MLTSLLLTLAAPAVVFAGYAARFNFPITDLSRFHHLAVSKNGPKTQTIGIPVDHFNNATNETFKNRYWYNDTFYEPNGPVFVYDAGEGNAQQAVPLLEEIQSKSAVMQLARRYNGIGIVWEHRYYGESVPFITGNLTGKSLTAQQWQFHTVEQALEDVVYFANRFSTSKANASELVPSKTPWVFMGGSYPGIRAALLRIRNPDTIYASWASSAPVQAQVNMSSYADTIERALARNCSNDFIAMANYIDSTLAKNNTDSLRLKQRLGLAATGGTENITIEEASYITNGVAGRIFQSPFGNWQYLGLGLAQKVCDLLETANGTQKATGEGLFATSSTADAVDDFLTMIRLWSAASSQSAQQKLSRRLFHVPADNSTGDTENDNNVESQIDIDGDTLAWRFQSCSQFGFFQAANPNNTRSIQSQYLSYQFFQDECNASFPKGALPPSPAVEQVLKFGGWGMNPSRVMFTNGEIDPWRSLGVASEEYNAPQRKPNQTIPSPTGHFDNNTYFGIIYDDQVHARDLSSSDQDTKLNQRTFDTGLQLFTDALDVWLPAFNSSRDTQSNSSNSNGPATNNTSIGGGGHKDKSNNAVGLRASLVTILIFGFATVAWLL